MSDLNVDNYSFDDILRLFKINKNFTQTDLTKCKETVEKLHPSKSSLNNSYYELFNKAYAVLEDKYYKPKEAKLIQVPSMPPVPPPLPLPAPPSSSTPLALPTPPALPALASSMPAPTMSTRMVTIHTEDRDVIKYPLENAFEIQLPTVLKNVLSIELFDITLPTFYYNLSDQLQNTKCWFSVPFYFADPVELTLASGSYAPADVCAELTKQLNAVATAKLFRLGVYVSPLTQYANFSVTYGSVERRFTFSNPDQFSLWFDKPSAYDKCAVQCWKMLTHWGLPYNLGFYKSKYDAAPTASAYGVTSPQIALLEAYDTIYMEMDAFNWIDEVNPYSLATTDLYNNDFNGSVNNSFAKLILANVSNSYDLHDKFKRVLPHVVAKIGRLKFRFRYHNGVLVDFNHQPFNFALKVECKFNL
jgi:hypothetical protein